MADITLGYKTIDSYLSDHMFQGALIGRYAGRISNGSFRLCELEYHLAKNNGPNTLHGGNKGFDKVVWDTELDGNNLMLTYISPDMEEGYPGILKVTARYFLNESNELSLELVAVTDKKTVVNLSNHPSFNLKGEGNGDILNHKLMINGSHINTLDENLIPTGEFMPVKGTPFDFTQAKPIGQDIDQDHPQLIAGNGYDHNWVLDKEKDQLSLAARVSEPTTGRILEIYTTDPGIQFYSGNFMDGTVGKSGKAYKVRSGFVLEPQHFPDSPNKPAFPSVVLELGEEYHHLIVFKFAVEE
jgi:aldose 1-epimerase